MSTKPLRVKVVRTHPSFWHYYLKDQILDMAENGDDVYKILDTPHNRSLLDEQHRTRMRKSFLGMSKYIGVVVTPKNNEESLFLLKHD